MCMVFDTAKDECTIKVLKILNNKKSRYSELFKKTQVSHTTLQAVLEYLDEKRFISKEEGYKIMEKGTILLKKLENLNKML